MSKVRSILRLIQQGLSKRKISVRCRVSRKTIDKYEEIFSQHPLSYLELLRLSDKELYSVIAPPSQREVSHEDLYHLFPHYERELKRIGVTKLQLWEKYKEDHSEGVQYSQFCEHFRRYLKSRQLSYVHDHKAGDKLMVDFAGKKLHLTDPETGELIPVEFFVGILPCSGLTYGQACMSTQSVDFIDSIRNCLEYIGGVPCAIVTDNLKPAVNKASKYDPEINRSMADLVEHYNMCVLPTRTYKPKDKALVEGAVNILYTRVYAPIRNEVFYSLEQLNEAIRKLVDAHNRMLFQQKEISRLDQFNAIEKDQLKALPSIAFISRKYQTARIHPNCHVQLSEDKHHYSVPFTYVSKEVEISYGNDTVEIYYKLNRIAIHNRARKKHAYTTLTDHLHPNINIITVGQSSFF
ncbi:MAG: IS21 family transposase [Saprospiraceae bacterium]